MHGLKNIKHGKQWVEGCMGLRVFLDPAVRRKICASARQFFEFSLVHHVVQSLY